MKAPYYERDGVRLYLGDCRDALADVCEPGSVDLLLTDPPYGMAVTTRAGAANIAGDGVRAGVRIVRGMLSEMRTLLTPDAHAHIFCHSTSYPDFTDAIAAHLPIKSALIWWKNQGGTGDCELEFARDYEMIVFAACGRRPLTGRRDGSVLTGYAPPHHASRIHPTQKPVALLRYLIGKSCPIGGLVVDPFAGSGSTLQAALESGRRAVGIEIDERHCEAAAIALSGVLLITGAI